MDRAEYSLPMEVIRPRINLYLDRLSGPQWIRLAAGYREDQTVYIITEMCEDVIDVCLKHILKKRWQLTLRPGEPVNTNQCLGSSVFCAILDVVGVSGCDQSDLTSDLNRVMNEELNVRVNSHLSTGSVIDTDASPCFDGRVSKMVRHVLDLLKILAIGSCCDSTNKPAKNRPVLPETLNSNSAIDDGTQGSDEATTEEGLHKWDKLTCGILVGGFVQHAMKGASFKLSRDDYKSISVTMAEMLWTEISGAAFPVRPYGKGIKRTVKDAHRELCKVFGSAGTLRLSLLTEDESVTKQIVQTLERHLVSPEKENRGVRGFCKVIGKKVAKPFTTRFSKT